MENTKNNMAAFQPDGKNVGGEILTDPIPFSFKNDSNNFLLYGTRPQIKAFMRHLIERFGDSARLGDVLSGSKITERRLDKIEERRNI